MTILVIFFIAIFAVVILLGVWGILIYNQLVTNQNMVKEGWSGIDVQLKRRYDLIPNLVDSVKGYMGHERGVLENVTALRAQCSTITDPAARGQTEGMLSGALTKLFALSENYPDLKASQNFIELQKTLSDIEEQIQLARRYYNGAARNLNILVESFPSNMIANNFRFEKAAFFELENPEQKNAPKVQF